MRLLLNLKAMKNCSYDQRYFHKFQGFIYNLLRDTPYEFLHDKPGYKFFCFSNIFPIADLKANETKRWLISSPDRAFIKILKERLETLAKEEKPINLGEMSFLIKEVTSLNVRLKKNSKLRAATPIIIRIPERNYERYDIPPSYRKKHYVFWRPCYSFEAFVKQLEENLIKKYNEFHKTNLEIERIFELFKFIKGPIANHVLINGKEQLFIGSLWEFHFSFLTPKQKKILSFAIDCGFGERNSFGFGFMNILKN